MTVGELINILIHFDCPEADVILSVGGDGATHTGLAGIASYDRLTNTVEISEP